MPQPVLLTYRVPAKHAAKLRVLAVRMGIRVRAVEKWEYIQPVGSFTGDCEGFESFYDGRCPRRPAPGGDARHGAFSAVRIQPLFAGAARREARISAQMRADGVQPRLELAGAARAALRGA